MRTEIETALQRRSAGTFPPLLEALYMERRGAAHRTRLSVGLMIFGALVTGTLLIDWLNDAQLARIAWLPRLLAGALCAACGIAMPDARSRWQQAFLFSVPALAAMVITEILGEYAPARVADRYMVAATLAVVGPLATLPLAMGGATILAILATLIFPLVPFLVPGALPLRDNLDVVVFASGGFGVAWLVARRNEVGRRMAFLHFVRDQSTAAEMSLLNAKLLRLSTTDELTGLANRRHFEAEFTRLWHDPRAPDFGIAVIDVDNFKAFNDSAGHAAGDACLRQVALALAGALRDEFDLAARYGGEEFVVLLRGIRQEDMILMGERLHLAVANLRTAHPGLPGCDLSISVGLAWQSARAPREGTTDVLLRDADRALYADKEAGRHRVVRGTSLGWVATN